MIRSTGFVALAFAAALPSMMGCEKSATEAKTEAVVAEQRANERTAREVTEANEKIAAANRQADDKTGHALDRAANDLGNAEQKRNEKTAEAVNEANRDIAHARAQASEQIAESQAVIDKRRVEYRKDLDGRLADLDKRFVDLRAKVAKSTKPARTDAELTLNNTMARFESVKQKIGQVDTAAPAALEQTKKDAREMLDAIEKTIKDTAGRI